MKARIEKDKVTLYDNDFYMSIWADATIHTLIVENNGIRENNFTTAENRKFDAMYKNYINHDYELVA